MRVGVTSQNFRTITGHAGRTRRFIVYEGDPHRGEVKELERWDLPKALSLHEYRGEAPHPTASLDVLVTAGCGEGFRRRMAVVGTRVVVTAETDPLKAANAVLRGDPLPPPPTPDH